jgi:hypothetical protein
MACNNQTTHFTTRCFSSSTVTQWYIACSLHCLSMLKSCQMSWFSRDVLEVQKLSALSTILLLCIWLAQRSKHDVSVAVICFWFLIVLDTELCQKMAKTTCPLTLHAQFPSVFIIHNIESYLGTFTPGLLMVILLLGDMITFLHCFATSLMHRLSPPLSDSKTASNFS